MSGAGLDPAALARLDAEPPTLRDRCLPPGGPTALGDVGRAGWSLLGGELLLPAMAIRTSALEANVAAMAAWCRESGALHAPHVKTTMAPQIVERQLRAGAWGVTVATVAQARTMRAFGAGRILIANEVVEPAAIDWLAGEVVRDPGLELLSLVDAPAGVERLAGRLDAHPGVRLPVLVEVGVAGARAGVRDVAGAVEVARRVAAEPRLRLRGVECFEGVVAPGPIDEHLARVDAVLDTAGAAAGAIAEQVGFADDGPVLLSAGGSAFFDRVVERLGPVAGRLGANLVLRAGCYVTHDHGFYGQRAPGERGSGPPLVSAIEVWGAVLSRPEPRRAIVGLGRRDAGTDDALPQPLAAARDGALLAADPGRAVAINDQHVYLDVEPGSPLAPGDLVGFGISHPCTTFDRWPLALLVDDGYAVTGAVRILL